MSWLLIWAFMPLVGLFGWAIRCCCRGVCGCSRSGLNIDGYLLTINGSYTDTGCTNCSCMNTLEAEAGFQANVDLSNEEVRATYCGQADDYHATDHTGCEIGFEFCAVDACDSLECEFDCDTCEGVWSCAAFDYYVSDVQTPCDSPPCRPCIDGCDDDCLGDCYVHSEPANCTTCAYEGSLEVYCSDGEHTYCIPPAGIKGTECYPTGIEGESWTCTCDLTPPVGNPQCACIDPHTCEIDSTKGLFDCGTVTCDTPGYDTQANAGYCSCSGESVRRTCHPPYCHASSNTYSGFADLLMYRADDGEVKLIVTFWDINGNVWTSKVSLGAYPVDCSAIDITGGLSFLHSCWCHPPDNVNLPTGDDDCEYGHQTDQYCGGGPTDFELVAL